MKVKVNQNVKFTKIFCPKLKVAELETTVGGGLRSMKCGASSS